MTFPCTTPLAVAKAGGVSLCAVVGVGTESVALLSRFEVFADVSAGNAADCGGFTTVGAVVRGIGFATEGARGGTVFLAGFGVSFGSGFTGGAGWAVPDAAG